MKKLLLGASALLVSTSFAEHLPDDLKKLKDTFLKVAIDPADQSDYELGWEELDLGEEESLHTKKIIAKEIQGPDIDEEADYALESFLVKPIRLSSNPQQLEESPSWYTSSEGLAKTLYHQAGAEESESEYGPYYCGALKINEESQSHLAKGCLDETKKITDKILALKLPVTYVEVSGNWWGDYQYKALYVQSGTDPHRYVKITFDILHEI